MNEIKPTAKRKFNRLQHYNYSENGWYFLTICTKNHKKWFGKISNEKIILNDYGQIASKFWKQIPNYYNHISLDEWIIMPNHLHGIVIIENILRTGQCSQTKYCPVSTISKVVKSFKEACTKSIRKNFKDHSFAWQRSFYDHVIRSDESLYPQRVDFLRGVEPRAAGVYIMINEDGEWR